MRAAAARTAFVTFAVAGTSLVPAVAGAAPIDDVRSTVSYHQQRVTTFQNRLAGTDKSACGGDDLFCPMIAWVRREFP